MEKKLTISKKTLKIILGICIAAAILAVAGLFGYTYMADHNTLGRKISVWGVEVSRLDAKQAEKKLLRNLKTGRYLFRKMTRRFTA